MAQVSDMMMPAEGIEHGMNFSRYRFDGRQQFCRVEVSLQYDGRACELPCHFRTDTPVDAQAMSAGGRHPFQGMPGSFGKDDREHIILKGGHDLAYIIKGQRFEIIRPKHSAPEIEDLNDIGPGPGLSVVVSNCSIGVHLQEAVCGGGLSIAKCLCLIESFRALALHHITKQGP